MFKFGRSRAVASALNASKVSSAIGVFSRVVIKLLTRRAG